MRALALVILAFSLHAHATTYYVSNSGSDSQAGTSSSTAWRTIAHVNSITLKAGDTVLFQSGGLWREQLTVKSSGNPSATPITYGRYGSGALPIISGGNVISGFTPEAYQVPGYFSLSSASQYLSSPTSTRALLTGTSFRLAAHARLANYSASQDQILMAMDNPNSAATRHWNFRVTYGQLFLQAWTGASYTPALNCGVPNPQLINGAQYWFYVNVVPNNGSGGSSCSFYYSSDGSSYSQVGSTQTGSAITLNPVSNTQVTVGDYTSLTSGNLDGLIYSTNAWTDVTGTHEVLALSGNDAATKSSNFTSSATGETWTMVPGSSVLTPQISTTIYYTAVPATQPNQIFNNAHRLSIAPQKSQMASGDWWLDQPNERVYVYDDPNDATMEASARSYGILDPCSGGSSVVLNALSTVESNGYGVYSCGYMNLVEYGSSTNNYLSGVRLDGPVAGTEVTSFTASSNGNSGIEAYNAPSLLVDEVVANSNAQTASCTPYHAGVKIEGSTSTNVVVQNSNTSYNGIINGVTHPGCITGSGIWADTIGNGFTVRYNNSAWNNERGIDIDADNYAVVYGNVSTNNVIAGVHVYADTTSSVTGNRVYNNTFYGNGIGIDLEGPDSGSTSNGCMSNIIQNNIATGSTLHNLAATFGCENPGADGNGNVYTYNSFGSATSNMVEWGQGSTYSTYGAWEGAAGNCGSSGCSHSVETDPAFVNTGAANYALSSSSPEINAGFTLSSTYGSDLMQFSAWPLGVVTGYQSSYGSGWEVGAYLYTGK